MSFRSKRSTNEPSLAGVHGPAEAFLPQRSAGIGGGSKAAGGVWMVWMTGFGGFFFFFTGGFSGFSFCF